MAPPSQQKSTTRDDIQNRCEKIIADMEKDVDTAEVLAVTGATMDVAPASVQRAMQTVGSLGGYGGVAIPNAAPVLGQFIGGACSPADVYPKPDNGVEEPPPPPNRQAAARPFAEEMLEIDDGLEGFKVAVSDLFDNNAYVDMNQALPLLRLPGWCTCIVRSGFR